MADTRANKVKSSELELKDKLVALNRVTKVTKGGRTFTFAADKQRVIVETFPGVHVQLEAPPTGATYLVDKQGTAEKLAG